MEIDGQYSYVSTFFHPYIVGCYGAGNQIKFAQSCSKNSRRCGVKAGAVTEYASLAMLMATTTYLAF